MYYLAACIALQFQHSIHLLFQAFCLRLGYKNNPKCFNWCMTLHNAHNGMLSDIQAQCPPSNHWVRCVQWLTLMKSEPAVPDLHERTVNCHLVYRFSLVKSSVKWLKCFHVGCVMIYIPSMYCDRQPSTVHVTGGVDRAGHHLIGSTRMDIRFKNQEPHLCDREI